MKLSNRSLFAAGVSLLSIIQSVRCHSEYNSRQKSVSYDNGAKHISYIEAGPSDGPLLILMHGWPAVAETWRHQIKHFAKLGHHVIAPDMPGYGKSTANRNIEDYAHENIITGLLAMLESTGRSSAVWVGHDWGAGVGSSLVAVHPEVVDAMAWLSVPYKGLELGYEEVLPLVNRTIYPEDRYPYGQWEYQRYYEEQFDRATSVFNSSIGYSIRALYFPTSPAEIGTRSPLSEVRIDGGWFGGVDTAPPADTIPLENTLLDEELYGALFRKLSATGFGPADAYYMNHARNRAYNLEKQKNGGYLNIPCLFIEGKYDTVCDTVTSDLLSTMPPYCKDFSFASIDAGHWLTIEKAAETSKALEDWLVQNVTHSCPGKWDKW